MISPRTATTSRATRIDREDRVTNKNKKRPTGYRAPAAVELRRTRDCVVEYVFVDQSAGVGVRATGRGNTLYECQVAGGQGGYEFAGSLTDLRFCASVSNAE